MGALDLSWVAPSSSLLRSMLVDPLKCHQCHKLSQASHCSHLWTWTLGWAFVSRPVPPKMSIPLGLDSLHAGVPFPASLPVWCRPLPLGEVTSGFWTWKCSRDNCHVLDSNQISSKIRPASNYQALHSWHCHPWKEDAAAEMETQLTGVLMVRPVQSNSASSK